MAHSTKESYPILFLFVSQKNVPGSTLNVISMEPVTKKEELYLAPDCSVVTLTLEGVIAQSAPNFKDGGDLDLLFG